MPLELNFYSVDIGDGRLREGVQLQNSHAFFVHVPARTRCYAVRYGG